jgi:hypothetical protein
MRGRLDVSDQSPVEGAGESGAGGERDEKDVSDQSPVKGSA